MKNDKRLIVSLVLNFLTFVLVVIGTILMITRGADALAGQTWVVWKYFTFQSNIFMGCVALTYAIFQILLITKRIDKIPHVLSIFNLVGTGAVALTFFVVIGFLGLIYGYNLMYQNANFIFHLLAPLSAMIAFVVFTKNSIARFIQTLFALIPSALYGTVYLIVVMATNGYGDIDIDFYQFGAHGLFIGIITFIIVMAVAYGLSVGMYFLNKLAFKKSEI